MESVANLIGNKALVSKRDNRLATLVTIENDTVILDMEKIGKRAFPIDVVQNGFIALLDNKSLIKTFVLREVSYGIKLTPEQIYNLTCRVGDVMRKRFKEIDDSEVIESLKELYA